jgi:hypothetical protein
MSVIPLTVFLSLLLAALFVVLFACEQRRRPFSSPERDSLLPLADETSRPSAPPPSVKTPRPSGGSAGAALRQPFNPDEYF